MNKVQQLREVVKKLIPMIIARGITVTQVGAQAFVATDKVTLRPVRVNIPHLPDDADERLVDAIQGFIDHELGHVFDTDWKAVAESEKRGAAGKRPANAKMTPKQAGAFMSQVHNVVEDPYVERKMSERFRGSAYNVDKLHDIFIEKISKPAIDRAKTPQDRFGCIFVPLVRAWAGQTKFRDFLTDNGYDKDPLVVAFTKLVPDSVKARIGKTRNSWETLEIAEILFDYMHPEPPPPPALPQQSMADAINEEMKDQQEQKSDEPSDSEKSDDPNGEGNNQDKPEDQDDKGADGEQSDEQQPADQDSDDGEGDTGEGEADGEEGAEAEEGSEGEGKTDGDEESDAEDDEEGAGGSDADQDEDDLAEGDDAGGKDAGDEEDDGAKDGDSGDQAGGSSGSKDDDTDEGDEADDDDAAGDDKMEAEGGSGDQDGETDKEADGKGGGAGDEEDADDASDSDRSDDQNAENADDSSGAGDDDGDDEEGDPSEADGEVGSKGDDEGDQDDGESRSTGKKADAEDETETSRNDLEQAPESSPFQGVEIENLGDDMAKGIAFIITNEATRSIKGLDYRVYTTEWDVCEKFPVPAGDPEMEVYDNKNGRWGTRKTTLNGMVTELDERTAHMVAPMQKDIERMMAARSQVLKVPGYRSGRMHSGSLHRLRTGDDRVFRRLQEHKSPETAVTLLIDNSGSMSGEKIKMAMSAGYALSSTLQRVNIKHEVIGFTTMQPRGVKDWQEQQEAEEERIGRHFSRMGALYHPIYKDVNERLTPEVKRRFAIAPYTCPMSGNTDGEAVRFAGNRLALRTEPRKVLIVLSDGHPAGMSRFPEEIYSDLHRAVEECEKKRIETIGVGIMDDSVRTFYPKAVVLKDLAELPKQVMKELKGILQQ
jgi:cobalamin biosynthesis protein CobT